MAEDIMKKNKLVSLLMISMSLAMLVGCNKEKEEVTAQIVVEEERNMFGLTEGEQKMYAEYAAGVLMKYNAGSNMRVLEGQELVNQEAKEQAAREQAAKREQAAAEYAANAKKENDSKKEDQGSGNGSSKGESVNYISDMASATGNDPFSITYAGYEVTDSYPTSGEDVLLAIDAAPGKVFLVTKYSVTNNSSQTEELDMFSKQAKFKIKLNGTNYKSQYTLLLDDLSMYKGEIDAGATIDTVLIFEIPEAAVSDMGDMVLSITAGDGTDYMQLSGGTVTRTETAEPVEDDVDSEVNEEEAETESTDEMIEENSDAMEESESDGEGTVTVVGSDRD